MQALGGLAESVPPEGETIMGRQDGPRVRVLLLKGVYSVNAVGSVQ